MSRKNTTPRVITKRAARAVKHDGIPRAALGAAVQMYARKLPRTQVATMVGDAASQVSRMMTGHLDEFSADRMAKWLHGLGADISIAVKLRGKRRGRTTITVG